MKSEYLVDLESQQILLNAVNKSLRQQNHKLRQKTITSKAAPRIPINRGVIMLVMVVIPVAFFVVSGMDSQTSELGAKTKYLIQNLQGDKINTWVHWNLANDQTVTVNIVNADTVPDAKIAAIKDAILSKETKQITRILPVGDQQDPTATYYMGWQKALIESEGSTKFPIPKNFVIITSPRGEGDIIVHLSREIDTDGYTGYTKSTVEDGYILRSNITIYDVNNLSADQIGTIMRHEFGHALGLAHSPDPEDMMAPIITTDYPYVSSCDINGISALYDGKTSSEVICNS